MWENGHGTELVIDNAIGAAMLFLGHFMTVDYHVDVSRPQHLCHEETEEDTSMVRRTDQRWVPSLRESEAHILCFPVNMSNSRGQLVRGV